MTSRIVTSVLIALFAILLSACSKEPPKCSDKETLDIIKRIFSDQIGEVEGVTKKDIENKLTIKNGRADAYDEKVKKYTCSAKLGIAEQWELPIHYVSQLDDKNEHIVSINGLTRKELVGVAYVLIKAIREEKASKKK